MAEKVQTQEERRPVKLDTGIGGMAFGADELLTEEQEQKKREALRHFLAAYQAQERREYDDAVDLYKKSIEAYPTAEAYTFLGWAYNFMGLIDEAIDQCHRAIETDPDFGNPYNDIGAYLIEKGDQLGAVRWLERAMAAPRYQCYFYPHFNLGRIHEARGEVFKALGEYKEAIELNPNYVLAIRAFRRLQGVLN